MTGDRWNKFGIAILVMLVVMDAAVVLAFARGGYNLTSFWPGP
jgi:hypothetical protein